MYLGSHRNLGGNPELPDTFFFIIYQVDCLWFIYMNIEKETFIYIVSISKTKIRYRKK